MAICPITLKSIDDIVFTIFGSAYERSAITEWLREHETDPMTNQLLPSLHLFSAPENWRDNDGAILSARIAEIRSFISNYYNQITSVLNHARYADETQNILDNLTISRAYHDVNWAQCLTKIVSVWCNANLKIVSSIFDDDTLYVGTGHTQLIDVFADQKNTPTNLFSRGGPFMGVDLSCYVYGDATLVHQGRSFKNLSFAGSSLNRQHFIDCQFNGSDFAHSDLRATRFERCTFHEGPLSFTEAIVDDFTYFIDCSISHIQPNIYVQSSREPERFARVMHARGLTDGVHFE